MSGSYERMNVIIHQGLRRDLERIERAARRPDPSAEQRLALARRTAWLMGLLHFHHTREETAIWPLAVAKRPSVQTIVAAMEPQHADVAEAGDQLAAAAAAYGESGTREHRDDLLAALDRMRRASLPHLEYEETVAVPELVDILDDQDWKQVNKAFYQGVRPSYLGWIVPWVLDDCDPDDEAYFRTQLPRPVLAYLTWRYGRSYAREASLAWGDVHGVPH